MQVLQDIIIWLSQEPVLWLTAFYLAIINILAIIVMWWDKRRAITDGWRVSEATLLLTGFIGGAIGLIIGMFGFHHKTRKKLFQFVALIGLIISIIIYWIEYQAILWHLYLT